MNLYLMRHGEAQAHAASDKLRQLTQRGIDDVRMVARQLASKGVVLDRCIASPYLRAQQSAAEFLKELRSDLELQTEERLAPSTRPSELVTFLQNVQGEHVLLVTHNPLVSEVHALLTRGATDELRVMGTSELVCISFEVVGLGTGTTQYRLLPSDHAWHD